MNDPKRSVIDDIDDLDGTDYDPQDDFDIDEGTDDVQPVAEGADTGAVDDPKLASTDNPDPNVDPAKPVVDTNEQQKQDQQKQVQEQFKRHQSGANVDNEGNIVDPNTGKIIAKAGVERRLFENAHRARQQVAGLTDELQAYKKYVDSERTLAAEIKRVGFTPEEVKEYFETAVAFKTNPVEATRRIVAHVLSMGYNASEIVGKDVGDAIDLKAVQRMLDERLKPILEPQQREQEQAKFQNEYNQWLNQFISEHEYADVHLDVIDRLIGEAKAVGENITAQKAYYRLREFCIQHDLDISRPLASQIHERQAGVQTNNRQQVQQPAPSTQQNRSPGIPRRSVAPSTSRPIEEAPMAAPSDSWDDIIKGTLRG
jgi:hypothetical protein